MTTDEELIAAGKLCCEAYQRGQGYSETYAKSSASGVERTSNAWAKQAGGFRDMGISLPIDGSTVAGHTISGHSLFRTFEQVLQDAKTTLETLEKASPVDRKLVTQWRWVVNAIEGCSYKTGFLPQLRDAGPAAY